MKAEKLSIDQFVRTSIRIRYLDAAGGVVHEQVTKNAVTNAFAGVMMTSLLASGPARVTHLYGRFGDDGSSSGGANLGLLALSDKKKATRSDFIYCPISNLLLGGLWVPVLAAPIQETTDVSLYTGNQSTFYFRIPYNLKTTAPGQISPSANFDPVNSYVATLGLAVAQDLTDRNQDIIIAQTSQFTPFPIPPGGQMAVDYTMQFVIKQDI